MVKTTDSSTLHNSVMWSSQENLQENNTGANSIPTPSPQGAHKWNIVQSSPEEFDAVAKAKTFYWKNERDLAIEMQKYLINNIPWFVPSVI